MRERMNSGNEGYLNRVQLVNLPNVIVRTNGDIQLVGGATANEGRVEVCRNQVWGTVCDDLWSTIDASVACGQLRFSKLGKYPSHAVSSVWLSNHILYYAGATAYSNANFGQGTGAIHLDDVSCTGSENSLFSCAYDPFTHLTTRSNFRVRLLLGCHGLESDATRFRVRRDGSPTGNPMCKLCNSEEEDPVHFLAVCNALHAGATSSSTQPRPAQPT